MPDWTAVRRHARLRHRALRAHLPSDAALLPHAEMLLEAAAAETGVDAYPVPPGDPLLVGAHAVLDRSIPCIWYAHSRAVSAPLSRFVRAHEYAHVWLHPDVAADTCAAEDVPADYVETRPGIAAGQVAEGYGPAERREREANLFAAELLLPGPSLRRLFVDQGWSASRIAAHVGVSEACVLAQLSAALLQAELPEDEEVADAPESAGPGLDADQRAAAQAPTGPLLVDAGPGTGKTRTLIARLAWLIEERDVPPDNILALTFSNRAAEEMRSRLRNAVGPLAERVWIGTFHAFGYEILRKDGNRIGLPPAPTLLDPSDSVTLLEQNLDRLPLAEYEYLFRPALPFPDILSCISAAKDELCGPEGYLALAHRELEAAGSDPQRQRAARRSIEIAGIYAVYQQRMEEAGLLDFGDLILRAVELLDRHPDVCARWQAQFPHLLADEYQDINRASAQLLRRLAGDGEGFWAVGDLRQAIYRFRGASPANVRDFERDFPGGRRLRLGHNYRSRPEIVRLASCFAATMSGAGPEERGWEAHRPASGTPTLHLAVAENEQAQADGLAARIRDEERGGAPLKDQAILCHTNRQAADLAEALEAHGIPTLNLGGFFEREEIRDLLCVLALAARPEGAALVRVGRLYNVPLEDVRRLLTEAREMSRPVPAALDLHATLPGLSSAGRAGLARLEADLRPILYRGDSWYLLGRYLFETSDYLRPLLADTSPGAAQRRTAIGQLMQIVQNLSRRLPPTDDARAPAALLDNLRHRLICGQDRLASNQPTCEGSDAVRLMTIHQSKGLEFPVVYLPDLAAGLFPPRKGAHMAAPPAGLTSVIGADEKALEEESEACLFFVALTRARDRLYLCRPSSRNGRAIGPCTLLEALEPVLDAHCVQRLAWSGSPAPHGPVDAEPPNPCELQTEPSLPVVHAASLEQYQQCPRRFYYRQVLRLPESEGEGAYLAFHRSLSATQAWLNDEAVAGRQPSEAELAERFEEIWRAEGLSDTAHARVLRARGSALVRTARAEAVQAQRPRPKREMVAHLAAGRVRVVADQAEELPDGTLRLIDVRAGRPGADDHTDPRLALLRHAATQEAGEQPIELVIDYLATGERKSVKPAPRWEPARVEKYNAALASIHAGRFAPDPEPRKCAVCPFYLICPV